MLEMLTLRIKPMRLKTLFWTIIHIFWELVRLTCIKVIALITARLRTMI